MNKVNRSIAAGLALIAGLGWGCSSGTTTSNPAANSNARPAANANTAPANSAPAQGADETPAQVKAAFPDAQSFTAQHKDVPPNAIAEIEKDAGGKVPDTDHHSYLAFSTAGGSRKQLGAATVVKAAGKDVVIVYESKSGSPSIKEVRADGVPASFLAQFAGKGHDDKFAFGSDVKANGADEATAKAIATAVWIDVLTMQSLYGTAHSH